MNETTNPGTSVTDWPEDYHPRWFTVADLAVMPSDLPSGPVRYELYHGTLITLPALDEVHGAVVSNLACELSIQGQRKGHGKARCGGAGIILERNPDHVFGADVLFVGNRRLPIRRSSED